MTGMPNLVNLTFTTKNTIAQLNWSSPNLVNFRTSPLLTLNKINNNMYFLLVKVLDSLLVLVLLIITGPAGLTLFNLIGIKEDA